MINGCHTKINGVVTPALVAPGHVANPQAKKQKAKEGHDVSPPPQLPLLGTPNSAGWTLPYQNQANHAAVMIDSNTAHIKRTYNSRTD